jgi:hypothetical protein
MELLHLEPADYGVHATGIYVIDDDGISVLAGPFESEAAALRWIDQRLEALRRNRSRDEGKEPIVLTFPAALDREITTTLRAAGFRFNKVLQHWEGLARPDEAEELAKAHGGTLRRIAATSLPSSAPELPTAAE